MQAARDALENNQTSLYFIAVLLAGASAFALPATAELEALINPALAFMLFVTFLQVPVAELGQAFTRLRFLGALLTANFIVVPLLVFALLPLMPADPLIRLGVLLVLLAPCIDYVVTFTHLGRGDARLLLAATPALLLAQMLALPLYLNAFLGEAAAAVVQVGPFAHAFAWLIAAPLLLAAVVQLLAGKSPPVARINSVLGLCPVPATALVLFIVVAAVGPRIETALPATLAVIPVYLAFAVAAPLLGWWVARCWLQAPAAGRAVAFSSATRNSLVVLPLGLAVPGALAVLPAVIITQTLVELLSELVYVRVLPRLGATSAGTLADQ
ncbi:arsenic resistance protein [Pseudomonas sp. 21LCFQ02]|uniref:arsenic resistance protein n=1 Tax=Pseudomonas sp. 21LCFQ02 TaxID=2957505 RepID=UPI00209BB593|nr:arsenic resistance protein [Pseudomonas sp. 21LCFQ02]MCO8167480.1 arsenic resistance protein [Pseudomonas sp. 21LCFQ02]